MIVGSFTALTSVRLGTPGWNAPQGVENVHTLCADKPESDDRGNDISLMCLERLCIKRLIKANIILIILSQL